jgi:hypothetical protein
MPRPQPSDPLTTMYARRRINRSQHLAGLEFRKHHDMARRGQPAAAEALARARKELGEEGFVLACVMLIDRQNARQIAASRGKNGVVWETYYGRRTLECLGRLAVTFGFAQASLHTDPRSDHAPTLQRLNHSVEDEVRR